MWRAIKTKQIYLGMAVAKNMNMCGFVIIGEYNDAKALST